MDQIFQSSNWIFYALIVIIPVVFFSLLALFLLRKVFDTEALQKNHDVAGFTFSIIGVLYSVVLGFTVISANERFNDAEKNTAIEAFAIADLYRSASFFSSKEAADIHACLREYVKYILDKDWGLPAEKKISSESQDILEKLWQIYYQIEVSNQKVEIWYATSISKLTTLADASLSRQLSKSNQLGSMMWALLIIGGFITICFMFFFGLESFRTQMVMTSLLAGYISFVLFLIYTLDNVFKGPVAVEPRPLEQLQILFDNWDK